MKCLVLLSGGAGGINYWKAPAHPLKFNGTFSGRDALTYQTLSLGRTRKNLLGGWGVGGWSLKPSGTSQALIPRKEVCHGAPHHLHMGAVTCAPPWVPAAHLNGIPRNVCSGRIRGVDTHNTGSAPNRNWHLVPGQDPKRLRGTHRAPRKHLSIPVTWWVTDSAASQLFHVTKAIFKNRSLGGTTGLIILFNMKTKVKKKSISLEIVENFPPQWFLSAPSHQNLAFHIKIVCIFFSFFKFTQNCFCTMKSKPLHWCILALWPSMAFKPVHTWKTSDGFWSRITCKRLGENTGSFITAPHTNVHTPFRTPDVNT